MLVGGAAAAWPRAAWAQHPIAPQCRLGILMPLAESDVEAQRRMAALRDGLHELQWVEGRNLQIDYRWYANAGERLRGLANELVSSKPDVILTSATEQVAALQRVTRTIPIIIAQAIDPVGSGLADNFARPGGNVTGFSQYEASIGPKWLEVLKLIAPRVKRVGIIYDPANPTSSGILYALAAASSPTELTLTRLGVRNEEEINEKISAFAGEPNGGLIVVPAPVAASNRDVIIGLAAKYKLPAVYGVRHYVESGGLVSYGADNLDLWHRAASYVDRICKGEASAVLPIQLATKFEMIINLKTAKALGLAISPSLLATADEVIE